MKMENYFFADSDQRPVLDTSGKVRLVGQAYGRDGFEDGTCVCTSHLVGRKEKLARTASGSIYELGNLHADYAEMIEANKAGMTIIFDWYLMSATLVDDTILFDPNISSEDLCADKLLRKSYVLYGKDQNGTPIVGEVTEQEGNFVTLLCLDEEGPAEKEVKCFVVWPDVSAETMTAIQITGEVAVNIPYKSGFEKAFNLKCRPIIPLASK